MAIYKPVGTCSSLIQFEIKNGMLTACSFEDGCDGNLTGLSRLVLNRPVEEVIRLLEGIECQNGTSCPDQLARALKEYLANAHD